MTRLLRQTLSAVVVITGCVPLVQGTILPAPVDEGQIEQAPYSFNGLIATNGVAAGSASMVGKGIFAIAAHVVSETTYQDGKQFRWMLPSEVRYFPAYNTAGEANPTGPNFTPAAFYRWESYSARVLADTSGPGLTLPDTKNLDFVVGRFSNTATASSIVNHAEVNVDSEFEVSILRDRREKTIIGYPDIPNEEQGLMHATIPGDYFCWWHGTEGSDELDPEGRWDAIYLFEGVSTYAGGSGGPIYVKDDLGNWVMSGIVSSKLGSNGMFVRGFDEAAWELVEQADFIRNQGAMRRVDNLTASLDEEGKLVLEWTDHSSEEVGYKVFRHFNGIYEEIVTLPADREFFIDYTVLPGHIYHYRVQPITADGNNLPPKSAEVRVATSNSLGVAREALGQPWLQFTSDGDSTWFIDDQNRLRSGKVRSLGSSSLIFEIIGPGTLDFEWSVSSEVNPFYSEDHEDAGIIFDALYLYLDGEVMIQNNEQPVFLSGIVGPEARQVTIPQGAHVLEWRYEKDPYTDEHDDAGYLSAVNWIPDATDPYPVYGGYLANASGWHAAEWFGFYYSEQWPWILHEQLGWMHVLGNAGSGLYGYSELEEIGYYYTSPELFPFLYLPETGNWLYYYLDTGYRGSGVWLWDFASDTLIRTSG